MQVIGILMQGYCIVLISTSPNLMDKLYILICGVACYEKLECNPLFPPWASKEFRER